MPLKLHVGVTRKLGLPAFSSVGASCHIELELDLDPDILETDLDGFHQKVRSAYVAANQAVNDQLARLQAPPATVRQWIESRKSQGEPPANRPGPPGNAEPRSPDRPVTPNQVRAIRNLARRQEADLEDLLGDHDVARIEDLTLAQASRLIDRLRASCSS